MVGATTKFESWRQAVKTFSESTTAHGVSRIYHSARIRRVAWACLFAFSVGFVLYQIVILLRKYFSFESETELRVSYNRNMTFPAVTLCNLNPMRLSKIIDPHYMPADVLTSIPGIIGMIANTFRRRPWLFNVTGIKSDIVNDTILEELKEMVDHPNTTFSMATLFRSPKDNMEKIKTAGNSTSEDMVPTEPPEPSTGQNVTISRVEEILTALGIDMDDIDDLDPGYVKQLLYAVLFSFINEETMEVVGHQPQDFIRSCAFNGIRCNYTYFVEFQTDSFGNCFTFNDGSDGRPIRHSNQSGPKHSLSLELNVEQYEYVTEVFSTAGVRLIVHDQGIRPFPQEEGVNVAPGYHTYIGVSRSGIHRLSEPYGNCTDGSLSQNLPGYKYSVMACLKLCLQSKVESRCHCTVPLLPSSGNVKNVCSYKNRREGYLCMLRAGAAFLANASPCDCPEACNEVSFNMLLSFADWPNVMTDKKHLSSLVDGSDVLRAMPADHPLTDISPYRNNLLKLDIYYQELNDIEIIQKANYGLATFLSDIGGQCGLWVGMSVLTMCEGLELLMDILMVFCNCSQRKRDETQNVTPKVDTKPSVFE